MLDRHHIEIRVRYEESDPSGFLYHAHYFTYFEVARTELLRAAGENYRRMEEGGLFIVVVRAECRYRRPARYDDLVTIRTTVTRVTRAKMEHEYQMLRGDELLAVGHVTLAVIDRNGKVQRVPEWLQLGQ